MTDLSSLKIPSLRSRVSAAEWQARVDLAACYRLIAHFGMNDLVYNHATARVPEEEGHFLINAYGYAYEEVTASASSRSTSTARWCSTRARATASTRRAS